MDDPVVLVYQLWNHASSMKNTFTRNKIAWKTLTGRDLMDLTAYVQNVQSLVPTGEFSLPAPETGKPLFDANCGLCHRDYELAGDEPSQQDLDGHRRGHLESLAEDADGPHGGSRRYAEDPGVCLATAI